MTFAIGATIGPYLITDQLGRGGMATVFKAYHANLDRHVAIKVLHPAFKEDPSFLECFKREAQIVARLEHSDIISIYDFADFVGQPYLVMKFIEGETLKMRLKQKPLAVSERLAMLEKVASVLEYAHKAMTALDRSFELNDSLAEANLVHDLCYRVGNQINLAIADWTQAARFVDAPSWVAHETDALLHTYQ